MSVPFLVVYNIYTLITKTIKKICGVLAFGVATYLYFAGIDAKALELFDSLTPTRYEPIC